MDLHIITPATRLQNLPKLLESIKPGSQYFTIHWWIVLDVAHITNIENIRMTFHNFDGVFTHILLASDPSFVAGKGQINYALDHINNGYVYVLDDDNIIHPDFFAWFNHTNKMKYDAYIIAQQHLAGWIRYVHPDMVRETHIDQAQYILLRQFIGDERFAQSYCGDGEFIERLLKKKAENFVFCNQVLAYYNVLR